MTDFSNANSKKLGLALAAHITDRPDALALLQAATAEGNWIAKKLIQNITRLKSKHSPTVLIVDDEVELTEIYSDFLLKNNYKTMIAHNFREAMVKINSRSEISLMILDLKLPDMNGLQILKKLNEMKLMVGVPKFLCTAFATPDLVAKARELGVVHYLVKPVNYEDLLSQIQKYTSRKDAI